MSQDIRVRVIGDTSSLSAALDRSSGSLGKFGKYAKIAGAALVAGLGLQAKKSIEAASNLNESINAVNVTFGKAGPQILKFSKGAAQLGLSARAANEAAVPLGASLINAGFGAEEAAGKTQKLLERAADMASVFNTSVPDALQALQAGLRGESDPLERFGVGLSDAAVRVKAVSMGLIKSTNDALTPHAKAQARLALIMEQTNRVSGDFKNTSGGLANQQRILSAQWENLSATIGTALLPAVTAAISALNDLVVWVQVHWPEIKATVTEVMDAVRAKLDEAIAYYRANIAPAVQNVLAAITAFWDKFGADIMRVVGIAMNTVGTTIKNALIIIKAVIELFLAVLRGDWGAAWNALKTIASAALSSVVAIIKGMVGVALAAARALGAAILDGIVAGLKGVGGKVTDALGAVKDAIFGLVGAAYGWALALGKAIVTGIIGGLSGLFSGIKNAVSGAISSAVGAANPFGRAATSALAATTGSSLDLGVKPGGLALAGGASATAGVSVNFNGPVYGDPRSIAQAVREEFVKMQRSGTRLGFT